MLSMQLCEPGMQLAPHYSCCSCSFWVESDELRVTPAVVVKAQTRGGAGYPYGESSLCNNCLREAENASGGVFHSGPGVRLLPTTDGSTVVQ